jgi:hypothetical protein
MPRRRIEAELMWSRNVLASSIQVSIPTPIARKPTSTPAIRIARDDLRLTVSSSGKSLYLVRNCPATLDPIRTFATDRLPGRSLCRAIAFQLLNCRSEIPHYQ